MDAEASAKANGNTNGNANGKRGERHPGSPVRALTIAGSDSGGGAGIQADLKTFQELGAFGMSAVTAVTAQNSLGVQHVYPLPAVAVAEQLESVLGDIGADAVKTGMLPEPAVVRAAARAIAGSGIRHVVVDPVMSASDGTRLLLRDTFRSMLTELFPLAEIVTPNVPEACVLLGLPPGSVGTVDAMVSAARRLLDFGSRHVLLKGGHLPDAEQAVDVFVGREAAEPLILRAPRLATKHTHGTGCTLAAAAAAFLARGFPPAAAAAEAKSFVGRAIAAAVPLGRGTGALWHAAHRQAMR